MDPQALPRGGRAAPGDASFCYWLGACAGYGRFPLGLLDCLLRDLVQVPALVWITLCFSGCSSNGTMSVCFGLTVTTMIPTRRRPAGRRTRGCVLGDRVPEVADPGPDARAGGPARRERGDARGGQTTVRAAPIARPPHARCLVVVSCRSTCSCPSSPLVSTASAMWSNKPWWWAPQQVLNALTASGRVLYLAVAMVRGVLGSMLACLPGRSWWRSCGLRLPTTAIP